MAGWKEHSRLFGRGRASEGSQGQQGNGASCRYPAMVWGSAQDRQCLKMSDGSVQTDLALPITTLQGDLPLCGAPTFLGPLRTRGFWEVTPAVSPPALVPDSGKLERAAPLESNFHLKTKMFEEDSDRGKSDGDREGLDKGGPWGQTLQPKPILGLISPESSHTCPCICPENYEWISRLSQRQEALPPLMRGPPPSPLTFAA